MSMKSLVSSLMACAAAAALLVTQGSVRAQDNPGPLGVDFVVQPPAVGATAFPCQVGVRSLVTGEGMLLERFPAQPGKETKFRKAGKGVTVDVEVTVAPGGASVVYSVTVGTSPNTPLGMYRAQVKLHD